MEQTKENIKQIIQQVMRQEPYLTNFGMQRTDDPDYQSNRQALLEETEMFASAVKWLSQINRIKSINTNVTSYNLKHLAEKHIGYITNGVFIAAAIHCGFRYSNCEHNSPNVFFNMSQKSLNKLDAFENLKKPKGLSHLVRNV